MEGQKIGYISTTSPRPHPQSVVSCLCAELSPFIYKQLASQYPQMVPVDTLAKQFTLCM